MYSLSTCRQRCSLALDDFMKNDFALDGATSDDFTLHDFMLDKVAPNNLRFYVWRLYIRPLNVSRRYVI